MALVYCQSLHSYERRKQDRLEIKLQPLLNFDSDGCYNTAAIDASGRTNPGKDNNVVRVVPSSHRKYSGASNSFPLNNHQGMKDEDEDEDVRV